jgi:hypothetical protein
VSRIVTLSDKTDTISKMKYHILWCLFFHTLYVVVKRKVLQKLHYGIYHWYRSCVYNVSTLKVVESRRKVVGIFFWNFFLGNFLGDLARWFEPRRGMVPLPTTTTTTARVALVPLGRDRAGCRRVGLMSLPALPSALCRSTATAKGNVKRDINKLCCI